MHLLMRAPVGGWQSRRSARSIAAASSRRPGIKPIPERSRMATKRSQKIPPPQRVEGIVFHVALHFDRWVEVIGVPFEHRGRTWAIHRSTLSDPHTPALYSVSDVETGRSLGHIMEPSIDGARTTAIQIIDRATPEQWTEFFRVAKPRARARTASA
ncbi:hypothetical protein [Burkholderia multivorans]|nr:hypothetical protein [Burkholderia multivorans]UQO21275.1 hypothetical protein L0Z02_29570 [Burkholderia multivorans]